MSLSKVNADTSVRAIYISLLTINDIGSFILRYITNRPMSCVRCLSEWLKIDGNSVLKISWRMLCFWGVRIS